MCRKGGCDFARSAGGLEPLGDFRIKRRPYVFSQCRRGEDIFRSVPPSPGKGKKRAPFGLPKSRPSSNDRRSTSWLSRNFARYSARRNS